MKTYIAVGYTNDCGSCLQDEIEITYKELVDMFGLPNTEVDMYKTEAEWSIMTPVGFCFIYNYKTGKCYDHEDGQDVEDITDWHLGGNDNMATDYIKKLLNK